MSNLVRTTRFWNNFHQVRSVKIFENQIILKSLGARKTKSLNMIAKVKELVICLDRAQSP
jgi:hypothetical protein